MEARTSQSEFVGRSSASFVALSGGTEYAHRVSPPPVVPQRTNALHPTWKAHRTRRKRPRSRGFELPRSRTVDSDRSPGTARISRGAVRTHQRTRNPQRTSLARLRTLSGAEDGFRSDS